MPPARKKGVPASGGRKPAKPRTIAVIESSDAEAPAKRMSALDAAAKVLCEYTEPLSVKQIVESMSQRGYWQSPGGKTPHATLYSAMLREIAGKGTESRFIKIERGKFTAVSNARIAR